MTHSKPVQKPVRGRPFQKGEDPRRNTRGNLNAEAQAWEILFRNNLARKLSPEEAADIVIRAYRKGQAWAVGEIHDRLMGKVTQPIKTDQDVTYRVIYDGQGGAG